MSLTRDWPGMLIMVMTFLIVYRFWKMKKNKSLSLILGFVVFLHHIIVIVNTFIFTLPGAESDPATFHYYAAQWAESGNFNLSIGSLFYQQFLGILYRIFTPSRFFGSELSVLFFLFTCLVFIELLALLKLSRYTHILLLMLGLWPTYLIFYSKILRESYILFFFIFSIYWGLRYHLKPNRWAGLLCISSIILMTFFHRGTLIYALLLLPLLLIWPLQDSSVSSEKKGVLLKRKSWMALCIVLVVGVIIIASLFLPIKDIGAMRTLLTGRGLQFIEKYRTRLIGRDGRADYGIVLDASSVWSFITSSSMMYLYYLFAPFPWQVSNALDFYGVAESFFRFILIALSLKFCFWSRGKDQRIGILLMVIYFSQTFLWATGTVNYGTSIRHHTLTNWIILILGLPVFLEWATQRKGKNRELKMKKAESPSDFTF